MSGLTEIKTVYFLGIGGIGMSALARYFNAKGANVSGYDKTATPLTRELEAEGMKIHYHEDPSLIPENVDLIIYTPAIPKEHAEFAFLQQNNIPLKKRSEVLGLLTRHQKGIGIAGTHGKTTITTLTAHLMKQSAKGCSAFLGGISKNYNSNLILSPESPFVVIEADEFDRSFLQLEPEMAVISSMDADHLDIYGDHHSLQEAFSAFASRIKPGGILIRKIGLLSELPENLKHYTYSLENVKADFHVRRIRVETGSYFFDMITPFGELENLQLNYPGLHNIENAVAAIALAMLAGVLPNEIRESLPQFQGVKRRFDIRLKTPTFCYIDDYAHHPAELEACIKSVRHLFPGKKITAVFQPHLYTRTRDFADQFARSLELVDELFLLDIYPAREWPIKGVTSAALLNIIRKTAKKLISKEKLVDNLLQSNPEVLLTLGAGDIDQLVLPIEEAFRKKMEKL